MSIILQSRGVVSSLESSSGSPKKAKSQLLRASQCTEKASTKRLCGKCKEGDAGFECEDHHLMSKQLILKFSSHQRTGFSQTNTVQLLNRLLCKSRLTRRVGCGTWWLVLEASEPSLVVIYNTAAAFIFLPSVIIFLLVLCQCGPRLCSEWVKMSRKAAFGQSFLLLDKTEEVSAAQKRHCWWCRQWILLSPRDHNENKTSDRLMRPKPKCLH